VQNGEQKKMLKILTKTKPWMVASLLVASSAFGQQDRCQPQTKPCEQPKPCAKPACPCPEPKPILHPEYNAPARFETRCGWDFYADASFIYWQPIQENMELGIANTNILNPGTVGITGNVIEMDFSYKPGFKVGVGMYFDHDDWDAHAEYTWFHGSHSTSSNAPIAGDIYTIDAAPGVTSSNNAYNSGKEHWNLKMDLLDVTLGRWGYTGTKLTMRPFFGARAAWIRQKKTETFVSTGTTSTGVAIGTGADTVVITGKSQSWAIGPTAGLNTNWTIGEGFRLFGDGSADILYTRYTSLAFHQTSTSLPAAATPANMQVKQKKSRLPPSTYELGLRYWLGFLL
jgi:hypothetical protein